MLLYVHGCIKLTAGWKESIREQDKKDGNHDCNGDGSNPHQEPHPVESIVIRGVDEVVGAVTKLGRRKVDDGVDHDAVESLKEER